VRLVEKPLTDDIPEFRIGLSYTGRKSRYQLPLNVLGGLPGIDLDRIVRRGNYNLYRI